MEENKNDFMGKCKIPFLFVVYSILFSLKYMAFLSHGPPPPFRSDSSRGLSTFCAYSTVTVLVGNVNVRFVRYVLGTVGISGLAAGSQLAALSAESPLASQQW